ncbi:trans-sulfuration enzyme family protein [Halomicrococcus gelatinilyticus]|uniref:trans-sulfuration enzyme family protein n=1 Tax=Halomicrococcus gelatinilyticus TaxID=1702103 RepID=UPI002E15814A
MADPDARFETLAVGGDDDRDRRAPTDVVDPLHLSTTYTWDELDKDAIAYEYSRIENPTRDALEERLAALEGGEHARAFASGTAAIFTAVLTQVGAGGHVVAFDDLYSGTERMLSELFAAHLDVDVSYVDARDAANVADAVRPETGLVWLETPTNPMLRLCDVEANAAVAQEHGVPLGIDSTFMSPYFQQPLDLGADLVVHSTTKYLNGHSDSNGGVVVTSDDDVAESLSFAQGIGLGNPLSPFDAFLVTRGLKTLALRMERHEENALRIARFLDDHERVRRVRYPGLESHPQHDLARRQTSGFGGMLSFEFDGSQAETAAFVDRLEEFSLAVSLGGVESLVEVPSLMTHDEVTGTDADDIPETLVRVSVGVEHAADLLDDLRSAFPD